MAIYFTSDLHLNHNKEFIYKARGFNKVDDMNQTIINNFNSVVTDEDDLYILGDLMLGDAEAGINLVKQLKGKLHIILGNHDTDNRIELYAMLPNVVEARCAKRFIYKGYHFFLTHFPCLTGSLEHDSLKKTTCNLFGHTHQKTNFFEDRPYMYHVGVDSHDCKPINIDDIISDMENAVADCVKYL